ncbi:MAG: FkbM family methyltransferase [Planctomycetota bacterium]|jgi:FkbM family methyltransferase
MTVQESIAAAIAKVPQGNERLGTTHIPEATQYCKDASLVFEIGAYIGFDIPVIHEQWPGAVIHAFEPDPDPFKRLQQYASMFISCNQVALSNKVGTVDFYQVYDSNVTDQETRSEWFKTAGSLLEPGQQQRGASPSLKGHIVQVECDTLDRYCAHNGLQPEVLLMDTQGSEYEILEGAASILPGVQVILLEWSVLELYKGQKYLDDIQELLKPFGFEMKKKIDLWSNQHGDAIFAR